MKKLVENIEHDPTGGDFTSFERNSFNEELDKLNHILEGSALKDEAEQYALENLHLVAEFQPDKLLEKIAHLSNTTISPYTDDDSISTSSVILKD
ncbi:MAG: hypothetical protein AAF600_06765 [Bacteroidota bacterium]